MVYSYTCISKPSVGSFPGCSNRAAKSLRVSIFWSASAILLNDSGENVSFACIAVRRWSTSASRKPLLIMRRSVAPSIILSFLRLKSIGVRLSRHISCSRKSSHKLLKVLTASFCAILSWQGSVAPLTEPRPLHVLITLGSNSHVIHKPGWVF